MKKITAIICEYNPFHNGHLYQLKEAKKVSDVVICIMSGNTVQRGGFAISDKYERAKTAVKMGADIVVEHIFPHSMSSARDFAKSGIFIANALRANFLAFGHESDKEKLMQIANILANPDVQEEIKKVCIEKKNLSYPKAREIFLSNLIGEDNAILLRKPNNILTVEYLMVLNSYKTISPLFIKRNNNFLSATEIRKKIFSNSVISEYIPTQTSNYLMENNLDLPILAILRSCNNYSEIYDCDYSLYCRIISESKKCLKLNDVISNCVSSAYTASKIRRCIYSIAFGTKPEAVKKNPEFTILLAASEKGIRYLSEEKKQISIPILTRMSDAKKNEIDVNSALIPDTIYSLLVSKEFSPFTKPHLEIKK